MTRFAVWVMTYGWVQNLYLLFAVVHQGWPWCRAGPFLFLVYLLYGYNIFSGPCLQSLEDICKFLRFWWPPPLFAATFWTLQGCGLSTFLNYVLQILPDLCEFPRFWWPPPLYATTFWTLQGCGLSTFLNSVLQILQDLCEFPRSWWPPPPFVSTATAPFATPASKSSPFNGTVAQNMFRLYVLQYKDTPFMRPLVLC